MKDSNYHWPTLFNKYLRKEINDNELKALEHFLETDPEKMRIFRQRTDPQEYAKAFQYYTSINTDSLREKLEAKRRSAVPVEPQPVPVKKKNPTLKSIALAVLITAAAAVAIIFFRRPQQLPEPDISTIALNAEIKDHTYIRAITGQEYDFEEENVASSLGAFAANLLYRDNILKVNPDPHKQSDYTHFDLVTAPQKQIQLQFTDGSSIKLSSASAIRFPLNFKKTKRSVQMRGEAFFNVASNKDVPFVVSLSNGVQVKATGTSFNISSYDAGRVVMTLLTGTVEMIYGNIQMIVHEGQQVEFTEEKKFRLIEQPDLDQATAWIKNEFDFNNKDIKDVIREVGNYYHYNVIFKDTIPPSPVTGIFNSKKNNLTKIISAIEQLYQVDITPEGNTLIVSQGGPH